MVVVIDQDEAPGDDMSPGVPSPSATAAKMQLVQAATVSMTPTRRATGDPDGGGAESVQAEQSQCHGGRDFGEHHQPGVGAEG